MPIRLRQSRLTGKWTARETTNDVTHVGMTPEEAVRGLGTLLELGAQRCREWLSQNTCKGK